MDSPIPDLITELKRLREPLEHEETGLKEKLSLCQAQLHKLDAALLALSDTPRRASRISKRSVTKSELIEVITDLLKSNGRLSRADLEGLAKKRFSEDSERSLSGFGLRFKEAMNDRNFTMSSTGEITLAA